VLHNGEHCDYGHGSNDDREHGLQSRWTPGFRLAFIILALPLIGSRHETRA
jgi:hypothetical protein